MTPSSFPCVFLHSSPLICLQTSRSGTHHHHRASRLDAVFLMMCSILFTPDMPFHLMARKLIFGVIRAHKLVPDERIGSQMPPGKPEPRCHVTLNTGLRSAVVFTLCEALGVSCCCTITAREVCSSVRVNDHRLLSHLLLEDKIALLIMNLITPRYSH